MEQQITIHILGTGDVIKRVSRWKNPSVSEEVNGDSRKFMPYHKFCLSDATGFLLFSIP